jgi:hypothetical protein
VLYEARTTIAVMISPASCFRCLGPFAFGAFALRDRARARSPAMA